MSLVYRPLLKTKTGEAQALKELSLAARARIQPIFHVTSTVAPSFSNSLAAAWTGLPMGLDGLYNFGETGSMAQTTNLFSALATEGVAVLPCIEVGSPNGFVQGVQALLQSHGSRLIVKTTLVDLSRAEAWVRAQGWRPADVDLIVIAGAVADIGLGMLEALVFQSLSDHIVLPSIWNSITLAASAAPRDMGTMTRGRNLVPRLDWQLWQRVSAQFQNQLDYGDYATVHPDLTEPPGYVMGSATVSVKYSVDNDWIVLKGYQISGAKGVAMATQYRSHASALVAEPQFNNVADCWADNKIQEIAAGGTTSGNRGTWVKIAVNRHMSLTADLLP